MNRLKLIFMQTMMISTGMLMTLGVSGLINHLRGNDLKFEWYYPMSILLTGFLCALPTLLFYLKDDKEAQFEKKMIAVHFVLLYMIIAASGRIFGWYSDIKGLVSVFITYVIIYVAVWSGSLWFMKMDDNKINEALKEIQDKE